MRHGSFAVAAVAVLAGLCAGPAAGSGSAPPSPLYIASRSAPAAELDRLHAGRLGVLMADAAESSLYLKWRLLHGHGVGERAGDALSRHCCELVTSPLPEPTGGTYAWTAARRLVPGAPALPDYLPTYRRGPNYASTENCFAGAFETAAATLRDRVARFGADTPAVQAWLAAQDSVFAACDDGRAALPPLPAAAPAWLAADRAYQEAALALYIGRNDEAADRFAAIGRDRASPWRPWGRYLRARALQRVSMGIVYALEQEPSPYDPPESLLDRWAATMQRHVLIAQRPLAFARSRAAIADLLAGPAGTPGKEEAPKMLRALAFRDRPAALLAELDRELNRPEPAADILFAFRDYLRLGRQAATRPDAVDWILTIKSEKRAEALAHARARWAASRDEAWLLAALILVRPGDEGADALAADAGRVERGRPAWLTAQYHLVRLTVADADPAAIRARLDAILADDGLTLSERNLFSAARSQVATDLGEFARLALRRPYCIAFVGECEAAGMPWTERMVGRRPGSGERVGLGPEARAIIDRLPLDQRIALSRNEGIPAELRLDLALTGFARAVQLQEEEAIDALAGDLAALLPAMRRDWQAITALPPGADRRFAEFFAMAKIPGLRTDLVDWTYERPQGTVREYEGHWVDWLIMPRGRTGGTAPADVAALYPALTDYVGDVYWERSGDADLTCLGKCGPGTFPLHLPPFAAALQASASAERAHFRLGGQTDSEGNARPDPAGALSVWDETLAWAEAHPRDPRSPEALYRLIRVARWGANHNHLGRRAFRVLHARYRGSDWARRSPYFYDD